MHATLRRLCPTRRSVAAFGCGLFRRGPALPSLLTLGLICIAGCSGNTDPNTPPADNGADEAASTDARQSQHAADAPGGIEPGVYEPGNADVLADVLASRSDPAMSGDALDAYRTFLESVRLTLHDDGTFEIAASDQGVTFRHRGTWSRTAPDALEFRITHEDGQPLNAPITTTGDIVTGSIALVMFGDAGDVMMLTRSRRLTDADLQGR